ncbi:VOC family protein [Streptomyces sp. MI02-2A]|uniref:VOC family protein n=1 Tax=unclassified Streptomyces TaxID=2593676 RepID=UPI000E255F2A|nr:MULTISPECIES: VOC family protein [unclassified Streptomyces]MDX3265365.1 VOC family protein [Streptomyces sp. MI02-2A]REE66059.1 PhnB protein [Streptomyces sp. 3212.3]
MASRLNPYLMFAGDARQALQFYKEVFGGTLVLSTYGEAGQPDTSMADKVMHGMLETPSDYTLMAADTPAGEHKPGNAYSVSLSGDDDAELRGYWEKLSDGATVAVPLDKQMWGDVFGMCTDRFGITWMVNIAQPQG